MNIILIWLNKSVKLMLNMRKDGFLKKILILSNSSGGLYNFRFELIKKLTDLNYEVFFSVPQDITDNKVKLLIETGANFIHTPMNRRGMNPIEDLKLINLYKKIVNDIYPDIILTYTIKPNIYGNYVANKFKIPVIMNITGIGTSLSTGRFKWIIKKMYKYACNKANMIFFQNEGNYNFFISNNLVNNQKTILIPGSGVNLEKFKPVIKPKKDNVIRFIFIGRIMKDKGIEEYLEAAKRLVSKVENLEFNILGSFEELEFKNIIEQNSNGRIKYLGVSNDVRKEISEIDCIVNPSYHEGMSNVLLEGAAMGKPLLASNIPGCKEIVDDGVNGFLFEPKSIDSLEEAIIKFVSLSDEDRKNMGQKSREKVEKGFDRNIVINQYIKVIKAILGEGEINESIWEN